MNKQQEAIRDQQAQSWNTFSGGWKKWDAINMDFLQPLGKELIEAIHPSGNDVVLDIAAGTGEPGLTIAGMLSGGKVVVTDLATEMVAIAAENARSRGIRNVETLACDVSALPFADNSFDAVCCRLGFMFFPDMQLAANEMMRVLKPGGRLATGVWNGADKNFWVMATMGAISKHITMPPPVPGAPGMFRCAQPGLMKSLFENAGLKNVREKEVAVRLKTGTAETYWNLMTEVGAPIVAALSKADAATVKTIKTEVLETLEQRYGASNVVIDGSALLLSAQK